jgi:hypothetical protein
MQFAKRRFVVRLERTQQQAPRLDGGNHGASLHDPLDRDAVIGAQTDGEVRS